MRTVKYGLRIKGKQELLRLNKSSNQGSDCCGEYSYTLCEGGEQEYLVDSLYYAQRAMSLSIPWYNSTQESPMWGYGIEGEELEVVEVTTEVNVKVMPEIKKIPTIEGKKSVISCVDLPKEGKKQRSLLLCNPDELAKEGFTLDVLRSLVGKIIYVGTISQFRIYDIWEIIPEKYIQWAEGKKAIGLVRGEMLYGYEKEFEG